MSDKAKPAHKIRHRDLSVTIWKNAGPEGVFYSVTPARAYKKGDAWQETDRFDFDDLLALAKLLDLAHSWIMQQQQADRKAA